MLIKPRGCLYIRNFKMGVEKEKNGERWGLGASYAGAPSFLGHPLEEQRERTRPAQSKSGALTLVFWGQYGEFGRLIGPLAHCSRSSLQAFFD